jgi:hypothetical protein
VDCDQATIVAVLVGTHGVKEVFFNHLIPKSLIISYRVLYEAIECYGRAGLQSFSSRALCFDYICPCESLYRSASSLPSVLLQWRIIGGFLQCSRISSAYPLLAKACLLPYLELAYMRFCLLHLPLHVLIAFSLTNPLLPPLARYVHCAYSPHFLAPLASTFMTTLASSTCMPCFSNLLFANCRLILSSHHIFSYHNERPRTAYTAFVLNCLLAIPPRPLSFLNPHSMGLGNW